MQFSFDQLMRDVAAYLKTDLGLERDIYSLVVPLPSGRQQEVAAAIRTGRDGREIVDFISTVGPVSAAVDPWYLLEANGQALFSRVTVSRQMIYVIASQLLATAQPEEVLLMLREAADLSDRLEHALFGGDSF